MGDLQRTKEYLERSHAFKAGWKSFLITLFLVAALAIAVFSIIRFLGRNSMLFLFIGVGLGGGTLGLLVKMQKYIAALCGEPLPIRPELYRCGTEMYHLSNEVILARRLDPELGVLLERAADSTLVALDRLPSLATVNADLAKETELGLHEAMHEVIAVARPFLRPKGIGKTRHSKQIEHLDTKLAGSQIEALTAKINAVSATIAPPESNTLRLDETLARLQELKVAEAELNESVRP